MCAHSPRLGQATYEELLPEDLLTFLDRLLVLAPDKRLSPRAALQSSKCVSVSVTESVSMSESMSVGNSVSLTLGVVCIVVCCAH